MFSADGGTGGQLWRLETAQVPTTFGVATIAMASPSGPQADTQAEGHSGSVPIAFNVFRTGDLRESSRVDFAVTANGTNAAAASDFGGTLPSGSISFAPGESQTILTINMSGDTEVESNEGFTVTLSNPIGATIGCRIANFR